MTIELTQEQHEILHQTARVETPAELQTLLGAHKVQMDELVREVLGPSQPVSTTLTELRDLALAVHAHAPKLAAKSYDQAKRVAYFDAIRLLDTAQTWFGEGLRTGVYRTRSVNEVVAASRPWRARIKSIGEHAFAFEPEIAAQFGDVNTSGTLKEELDDLVALNDLVAQHRGALDGVGLTESLVQQGKALFEEANGRDIAGIVGLRSQAAATLLRDRILTYAVALGREARAAGVNACFDDDEARRRFEAASFRDALRRLRPRRRPRPTAEPQPPAGAAIPENGASPA